MNPFKQVSNKKKDYETPLDLFPDLRPRKIAAPYDHQASLLRDYAAKAIDKKDVAIQGATGSGKTLVALLIAEWRRRRKAERAVYLCPTKQLVHQVTAFATDQMGLPACAFVGSKVDFSPKDEADWRSGDTIAITTYSALFNVRPFFASPNFIIVDDAHAADQYIADHWTARVPKDNPELLSHFQELSAILGKALPVDEAARLGEEPRALSDSLWVQVVPAPLIWRFESAISAVLDQAPERSDLAYRWSVLKGHLRSCQIYVSPSEIIVRPVLPPTSTFEPFCKANQRLYMSATLGRGGELERLSGRTGILRLPSPKGWDGNGVGRRFFMFPAASLDDNSTRAFLAKLIAQSGRALYLTSDERSARKAREMIRAAIHSCILFSAREIENSKEKFVQSSDAVAVIANRYDGIDFPNDECRLLIVEGRPGGAGLQERFLADKLGARALFAERIRTRIVQAFGRCTRSANDYAIVIALGDQLMDELALQENLSLLDTELQAEIRFGEAQSKGSSASEMLALAKAFLQQGVTWRSAEQDIVNLRDDMVEVTPSGVQQLQAAAPLEIEYISKLWRADFAGAVDAAQKTLTALSGGDELRGYRAWWHYLAGCAAQLEAAESRAPDGKATEHFRLARSVGGIRWLSSLQVAPEQDQGSDPNSQDSAAVEALEATLCELGLTHEARFAEKITKIRAGLNQAEASRFETAHVELGRLLGFQAGRSDAEGAPDPWWLVDDSLCFVFEDHSNAKPGNELSLEKARQASSHPAWIRENLKGLRPDARVIPILIMTCLAF